MPQIVLIILFLFSGWDLPHENATKHSLASRSIPTTTNCQSEATTKKVTVTFYCSCPICCGSWSEIGLTASQTIPVAGQTLAGDTKWLGKKAIFVSVPSGMEYLQYHTDGSQKVFTFEDTGNPDYISGDRVDIFMGGPENHDLCTQLGVMEMEIEFKK